MSFAPALAARLFEPAPVLLDGATGGALEDRGLDVHNPLWGSVALTSEAGRAMNRALHAEYVAAGAEIVIANTHNLGLAHCAGYLEGHPGAAESAEALQDRLHAAAIEDARASGARWVAGCLASPDTPYTTRAHLAPEQVAGRLARQWAVLTRLEPDLVLFEMLTTESDVRGVATLEARGPTRGAGLVCGEDGRLLDGLGLPEAVAILADGGFDLVFVQCTHYTRVDAALGPLVAAAARHGLVPGVYANDGRTWRDGGWCGPRVSTGAYAEAASGWVARGARVVGGCCGTGPEHVRALDQVRARASGRGPTLPEL